MAGGWKGKRNYTDKQMNKLFGLLLAKTAQYPNAAVVGHNHFANKPCPCFNVTQWFYDRLATPIQRGFITP
jgi:N-acetyl-anhydromuramyl-L-alanine amidase AmpD